MDGEAELERQTSVGSNGRGTTISSSAAPKGKQRSTYRKELVSAKEVVMTNRVHLVPLCMFLL